MHCDWENKTLQFVDQGRHIRLQGVHTTSLELQTISAHQLYKSTKGNEIWALLIVVEKQNIAQKQTQGNNTVPDSMQQLIHQYEDVFTDPQELPPARSYDHSIPLLPRLVPINSRPYHQLK